MSKEPASSRGPKVTGVDPVLNVRGMDATASPHIWSFRSRPHPSSQLKDVRADTLSVGRDALSPCWSNPSIGEETPESLGLLLAGIPLYYVGARSDPEPVC